MYALHLDYPKKLIHMFRFIQKIPMCLNDGKPLTVPTENDLLKE